MLTRQQNPESSTNDNCYWHCGKADSGLGSGLSLDIFSYLCSFGCKAGYYCFIARLLCFQISYIYIHIHIFPQYCSLSTYLPSQEQVNVLK